MTRPLTLQRVCAVLFLLVALAMAALGTAVWCGGSGCSIEAASSDILWQLRLPRALSAFAVGGLLALAGALMQLLLRNPLADPYILGISGGAATGAMAMSWLAPAALATVVVWFGAARADGIDAGIGLVAIRCAPYSHRRNDLGRLWRTDEPDAVACP